MNTGFREVARLLGISPNTERQYRLALLEAGLLEGPVDQLPDLSVLRGAVLVAKAGEGRAKPPAVLSSSVDRRGHCDVTERRGGDGDLRPASIRKPTFCAGVLSAIKRLCIKLKKADGVDPKDVAIVVDTVAGEVAQVDFGSVGKLDTETGRLRQAYVFTMVLGYSRHRVDRIVFDQKTSTWLRLHVEAFEELGGVPKVVVPDDLKAAVIRAAFGVDDDSVLNRSYRELARHYGFKVDPTPPRSPEKKGKVEAGVKYVKRSFFAVRKDEKDIDVLRRELARWAAEKSQACARTARLDDGPLNSSWRRNATSCCRCRTSDGSQCSGETMLEPRLPRPHRTRALLRTMAPHRPKATGPHHRTEHRAVLRRYARGDPRAATRGWSQHERGTPAEPSKRVPAP